MSVLTHRGWFGICPVYLGDIDSPGPLVVARLWILEPLLTLSTWAFGVVIFFKTLADPDFEAGFPIRVTGEIRGLDDSASKTPLIP